MGLLKKLFHPQESQKDIFLDEAAYNRQIESLAIDSAARLARGGVALQMGDVLSEREFQTEMEALRRKVEAEPTL